MRNKDKARPLTLTNDVCLFCRNIFGFLSYISTAAASHIIFWYLRITYLYINIYITLIYIYIYIYIYSYYISFYIFCILTYTLSFPSFFPSLHTYIFIYILSSTMPLRYYTRTYTHARIILIDKMNIFNYVHAFTVYHRSVRINKSSISIAKVSNYLVDFFHAR